jgi:tetraacyldisaccharide 4'-kinase
MPWAEHPRLALALRPLSWLYRLAWAVRRRFRPARPWRAAVPVISVGNLSVGGTGKSPLVRLLAAGAAGLGGRPAILLRGYGADPGPRPLQVSAGEGPLVSAEAGGDEAFEHARGRAAVWIDPDRRRAAGKAIEAGADCLILDDGFQRRWQLARDLDLVLADYDELMAGEALLPSGPWREPWSQVAAADAILIRGAPPGLLGKALQATLPRPWGGRPLFRLDLRPQRLQAWPSRRWLPLSSLKGRRIAALSALGRPQRFEDDLRALGADAVPWRFRDHHRFRQEDLAKPPAGSDAIVTTFKDLSRLPPDWRPGLPLWILASEAKVSPSAEFSRLWKRALKRKGV